MRPHLPVDGTSGVTVARKENPDLIILDIGLPGGDGFLLMERFRNLASLACVPVVVLSSRDPQTNKERALEAGAVAFLRKPPDNNELLAAIRKALGESDESAESGKPLAVIGQRWAERAQFRDGEDKTRL